MSTSIHPHVEIKVNGKWEHWSAPSHPEQQDYDLFGKMAGVRRDRDEITPICEPRGLPADVTLVTRMDYDWQGGPEYVYSASWFNQAELEALDKWYREGDHPEWGGLNRIFGYLFGNGFSGACGSGSYPPEVEDVRLVFWFDN